VTFLDVYIYISQASVLLPIIVAWVYYPKLNYPFRVLFYFFLLCLGFEILARELRVIYGNNMPGLHLYTIVQFLMFSVVFYHQFINNKNLQRLILVNCVIAFVIALSDALFTSDIFHSNLISRGYCSTFIILYTLICFFQVFSEDRPFFNRDNPVFWFNIAVLVYFANNLLYFMFRDYLLIHASKVETFSYCIYINLNIIAHLLYALSFRCFRKWKTGS
jgi:hypothetical protein